MYMCGQSIQPFVPFGCNKPSILWFFLSTVSWLGCMAVLFCFVLFALQLSVCLWWHDYRRDDFPTLKFVVVIADLARHLLREEPFALSAAPTIRAGEPGRC